MPPPPTIRRITSLKGLGVFRDYEATTDAPDLGTHNLIYGFNGSGKTTLSRVFSSLEAGSRRPELPTAGTFEVELSDGTLIKSTGRLNAVMGRLLVFNVDFIKDNLRWDDGTANPVFYLGKEQVEAASTLERVNTAIAALSADRATAAVTHDRADRTFADYKRDVARDIAEHLGLGRRYDASNLVTDYARHPYGQHSPLSETQRRELRSVIAQDAPLPPRLPVNSEPLGLAAQVRAVRNLLDTTLGTVALDTLREHESMLIWVKQGLDYHQSHNQAHCLFCANPLSEERMRSLSQAIGDKFDNLLRAIAAAQRLAEGLRDRLAAVSTSIPSRNDISRDLQSAFPPVSDLFGYLSECSDIVNTILLLLAEKAAAPNMRLSVETLPPESAAAALDETVTSELVALNAIIAAHNESHDNFNKVQDDARAKLKTYFLAEHQTRYGQLDASVVGAKAIRDGIDYQLNARRQEAEQLTQGMRQHGPAADMINRMIHSYLGHKELQIATLADGYQLRRDGRPVTGSLSEGEKTAIALCYFLSTLEAEGRQREDLIVVLDDPISSLDTKSLNYAFSIIKAALSDARQLILMTHNLHFMNEAKKWLKKGTEKQVGPDGATAALLFLDAVQTVGVDTRSSVIREMPRHIREYESEYQYLFHLVLQFADAPDGQTGYFYLMPNALRKVLEIFLAFKVPGSAGLSSKVDAVAATGHGLDAGRIRALDRLIQVESHSDNLDDLVTFSSMTIEETKNATDALLALMETLDKGHYDQMRRICRP
ncbi:MAG: AAA family ATPase [bacterium]